MMKKLMKSLFFLCLITVLAFTTQSCANKSTSETKDGTTEEKSKNEEETASDTKIASETKNNTPNEGKSASGLKEKIAESKTKWEKLKKEWNNTYSYITATMNGSGSTTMEITTYVTNGNVTKASRFVRSPGPDGRKQVETMEIKKEDWKGEKIGTLDDVYTFAAETLTKVSDKDNKVVFGVSENGIVSKAYFMPKDGFMSNLQGYDIMKIEAGK